MKSDDFYIGNYGDFLQNIDKDLQTAESEEIKQKLLRMKYEASKRVVPTDLSRLQVSLRTPLVSAHDKLRFLKDYVSKHAVLVDDPKTGDKIPDIQNKADSYSGEMTVFNLKLQNRVGDYIKNGTITLGSLVLPEGMKEEAALKQLQDMVNRMLPEVMSLRKNKEVSVAVYRNDYLLPSPYFPFVFSASHTSNILDKIRETQKEFGVSWPENSYQEFAISSEKLDELDQYEGFDMRDLPSLILDFMKTHNLRMESVAELEEIISAINIYQNSLRNKFYNYFFEGVDFKAIQDREYSNIQELSEDIKSTLTKQLILYFDEVPEIKIMQGHRKNLEISLGDYLVYSGDIPAVADFQEVIDQKYTDILRKESEAVPAPPEETPNEVPENTQDEYVAMIGNTYFLNKDINIRNTAKSLGGGAGFVGNSIKKRDKEICAKLPDAPTNSWVVSYAIFVKMKERHEKEFKKHNIEMWRAS